MVRGPLALALAVVGTTTSFHDRIHLDDESVLARTIFVDTFGVKATDFDLDRADQTRLFGSGRRAATKFLDGTEDYPPWDFDAYLAKFRRSRSGATPPS